MRTFISLEMYCDGECKHYISRYSSEHHIQDGSSGTCKDMSWEASNRPTEINMHKVHPAYLGPQVNQSKALSKDKGPKTQVSYR